MRNNTINLLELVKNNLHLMKDWDGLCMMPGALEQENKITIEERNFLSSFFREHFSLLEFNWTKGLKEPRIRWLEKQIKTLKDD